MRHAFRWLRGRLRCVTGSHVRPFGRTRCRFCGMWLMGE